VRLYLAAIAGHAGSSKEWQVQCEMADHRIGGFEHIFYPRSIALVGASKNSGKMGSLWTKALIQSDFGGPVYPVNPGLDEIFGVKVWPSLTAIPGPVDLVISCIPRTSVLDLLDDCAAKRVAAVHFFTAGFRETGEAQWIDLEEEMARRAKKGGFRIIGPNCIGVSCTEHRLPYGAASSVGKPGPVGFISQSGGHAGKMVEIGATRGIGFSKIASIGNCCDLGSADFLEYMAVDPKTGFIGLYLEGPRDTRRLFQVIRAVSGRKPVVVWKGGATDAGAKAASSHTGAMKASAAVWASALRQAGAIQVWGVDEMADTLLLLQTMGPVVGTQLGIVCGLTGDGDSEALLAADACTGSGIEIISYAETIGWGPPGRTREARGTGSIPSGLGRFSGMLAGFEGTMESLIRDRRVDIVVVYENADTLVSLMTREAADLINGMIVRSLQKGGKPIVLVSPPGSLDPERLDIERGLSESGIPVYPSMERAAKAIANVRRYHIRHNVRG
jgi:acyl-CoA synthetase (NDP forming)